MGITALFFIESLGQSELDQNISPVKLLREYFNSTTYLCFYYFPRTLAEFEDVFSDICMQVRAIKERGFPEIILHFSCHGSENDLLLTDGSIVPWDDLRSLLFIVDEALDEGYGENSFSTLVVVMSACYGIYASRIDSDERLKSLIAIILGPEYEISITAAMASYLLFYDQYLRMDLNGIKSVALMNEHNRKAIFGVYHSQDFLEEIKKRGRLS